MHFECLKNCAALMSAELENWGYIQGFIHKGMDSDQRPVLTPGFRRGSNGVP